jgi:predicted PurR-regulated permease PerM
LIGYAPALLLALSISSTTALAALVACLVINAFVGNVISPRIQGQAVRVHPLLVFLAATAGAELFGVPGVVLAVPTVAMLRVLFDFLRVRLRVRDEDTAIPALSPNVPEVARR